MTGDGKSASPEPAGAIASRTANRRDVLKAASALAAAFALGGVTFDSEVETALAAPATGTLMVEIPDLEAVFPAQSFQFGIGRAVSPPTGGGAGRDASTPSFSEITITKALDQYTALLQYETINGDALSTVTFVFGQAAKGAQQIVGTITISDVYVTGTSMSSGSDISSASESLSLNFAAIAVDLGGNSYTWNLATNSSE